MTSPTVTLPERSLSALLTKDLSTLTDGLAAIAVLTILLLTAVVIWSDVAEAVLLAWPARRSAAVTVWVALQVQLLPIASEAQVVAPRVAFGSASRTLVS